MQIKNYANHQENANLIFLKLAPIKSFCQSMCSFLMFFNFSSPAVGCKVGSPAGTFEACSMTQCWGYVLLRFLVVLADARAGWLRAGRGSSSLCLWLSAAGTSSGTWDALVLGTTRLGVFCFLFRTIPELPLGLRVASAVTCSACYNHNTLILRSFSSSKTFVLEN